MASRPFDYNSDEHIYMIAEGYHRCPDGVYRRTPSNGMFDGLCGVCEDHNYCEDEPDGSGLLVFSSDPEEDARYAQMAAIEACHSVHCLSLHAHLRILADAWTPGPTKTIGSVEGCYQAFLVLADLDLRYPRSYK